LFFVLVVVLFSVVDRFLRGRRRTRGCSREELLERVLVPQELEVLVLVRIRLLLPDLAATRQPIHRTRRVPCARIDAREVVEESVLRLATEVFQLRLARVDGGARVAGEGERALRRREQRGERGVQVHPVRLLAPRERR